MGSVCQKGLLKVRVWVVIGRVVQRWKERKGRGMLRAVTKGRKEEEKPIPAKKDKLKEKQWGGRGRKDARKDCRERK